MIERKDIPEEFFSPSKGFPSCETVGDLKRQLNRLPDDVQLQVGDPGAELTVWEEGNGSFWLEFNEVD